MKKKMIMLVAAAMMTLSASSAFAAFADQELIRIVYDRAGDEIATDLGKVQTLTAAGAPTTVAGTLTSTLPTSFVTYFAYDRLTKELWVSSTAAPLKINGSPASLTGLTNSSTNVYSLYNTMGGTNYTGLASAIMSYKNKLSSTQGYLNGAILSTQRLTTEASLASIATANVTQTLYYFADASTTLTAGKSGVAVASIVTSANGNSVITGNVAATPIPPAFFLMGSGLLGMFGLRRKNKVA